MATTQTSCGTGRTPRIRNSRSSPPLSRIPVGGQLSRASPIAPGTSARSAAARSFLPGPFGHATLQLNWT